MEPKDALRSLLERGVLFDTFTIPDVSVTYPPSFGGSPRPVLVPDTVKSPAQLRLLCPNEKCKDIMDWHLARDGQPVDKPIYISSGDETIYIAGGYVALEYRCRHTPDDKVVFFLARNRNASAHESTIVLVGRDPRPSPDLPPLLQGGLREIDRYLYLNALDCRARGFGIGGLVYMRRVVEDEMDRLLDLLIDALGEDDEPLRDILTKLKGSRQFSEKASVADAKLPPSFFPGSQNPFARLHELTSDGVHNLDDVESCERFDECRQLFEMLFEKLLRDRETKRLYRERLTSLRRKSP